MTSPKTKYADKTVETSFATILCSSHNIFEDTNTSKLGLAANRRTTDTCYLNS